MLVRLFISKVIKCTVT